MATPSPAAPLRQALSRAQEAAPRFARLSIAERISLVRRFREGFHQVAELSVRAACLAKGIDPEGPLAGEEWILGPFAVLRHLRQLEQSLTDIRHHGVPRIPPGRLRIGPGDRLVIDAFPGSLTDLLELPQHRGEIWMRPGITPLTLSEHQAKFYQRPHSGKVCAVLGGGNVNSIPPLDCLSKMFVDGMVCVLKINPVNAYLGPYLEQAFRPAVEEGYLSVVYGGADEGRQLIESQVVDQVHITGSDKTYEAIVWGPPGPERDERKRRNSPMLKKRITAELGNISPVVVVPGPYSEGELAYQARSIAGMVAYNASFNCVSTKLVVAARGWAGREPWLESIAKGLAAAPPRPAFYPGAQERWDSFIEGRPSVRVIGERGPKVAPYAMVLGVDPERDDERLFREEPWCGLVAETSLPAPSAKEFLLEAVRFLNRRVWGSLCATIIVHPKTLDEPGFRAALEQAIGELEYGTVAVNTFPGGAFVLGTPWGGFPKGSPADPQSGSGWVHNPWMLEGVEKCVWTGPLKGLVRWPWFTGYRTGTRLGRAAVDLEAGKTAAALPLAACGLLG